MSTLRLVDPNLRRGAEYVIDCVFAKKRIVEPWLRRHFQVTNTQFLIEHVKIRIRAELYEIRKDIKTRSRSEKREILNEGIEECFGNG